MRTNTYDELRVTLEVQPGRVTAIQAVGPDGRHHTGTFVLPFDRAEFEREVLRVARDINPGTQAVPSSAEATAFPAPRGRPRDVHLRPPQHLEAEVLGRVLADALFAGELTEVYDEAHVQARQRDRGLRLTLGLADAVDLLGVPWELLCRPSGFVACQERSPLVRHLGVGEPALAPPVDRAIRVLGVVASPTSLAPLDVAAEQRCIEQATAPLIAVGRLELEWLESPTADQLHDALRGGAFHILHFAGHGGKMPGGGDALIFEDAAGRPAPIDTATLRTILGGQVHLRLVVLNSCHGARSALEDPLGGVASAIIQSGVPSVAAMQFAISDGAALAFAAGLYDGLVGRHLPIDAAVADARLRVRLVSPLEFATPVVYVRDPDLQLFHWLLPALAAPAFLDAAELVTAGGSEPATVTTPVGLDEPAVPADPQEAPATTSTRSGAGVTRRLGWLLGGGATATAAAVAVALLWPEPDSPALAGGWQFDEWQLVSDSMQPADRDFDGLPSMHWTITLDQPQCDGSACTLDVTSTGIEAEFDLRPTGDGQWTGTIERGTWCEWDGQVTRRATTGELTFIVRLGDDTLDVSGAYEGETTPEGERNCGPDGPVVRYQQTATGRRLDD